MNRILIVDEREEDLLRLQSLLTTDDCLVDAAHDGAEALEKARRHAPDVLITGLLMPGMDGYALLRHWKADARFKQVPVIVYTDKDTDPEDERLALNLGADAFIRRTADPETLLARLRAVRANAATSAPVPPRVPSADDAATFQAYGRALIRTWEKAAAQLDQANRAQRQDIAARENAEGTQRQMVDTQVAILNALPAHIALVDAQGVVVAVNDAWRRFASANRLQGSDFCVGQNYLAICEQATGDCSAEAQEAAAGIRRVLDGDAREYALEYPCHSPSELRWFRLMVTPLRDDQQAGVVIMHVNVTAQRLAEQAVRDSEERLNFALAAANIGDWSLDLRTNVAQRALRHDQCFGYREMLPEWGYDTFLAHVDPVDRAEVEASFQRAMSGQGEYDHEFRTNWPDGSVHWLWTRGRFFFDEEGQPHRVAGIVADITERKQSEKALQRLLERLTEAQRIGQIGDWEWEIATEAITWSQEVFVIFGRDAALGPPRHFDEHAALVDAASYALMQRKVTLAIDSGEAQDYELVVVRPSGQNVYVQARAVPRKDGTGRVIGLYGTVQDISVRKRVEDALRDSEERFAAFMLNAPLAAWIINEDSRVVYANPGFALLFGTTPSEVTGKRLRELWNAEFVEEYEANNQAVLASGRPVESLEASPRPCGDIGRYLVIKFPIDASTGERWVGGTAIDVTEREAAREALIRSEQEFRTLAEAVPQIVWTMQPDGGNTFFNQRWMDYTGLTLEESLGRDWDEPFHPADRPRARHAWQDAMVTTRAYSFECRLRRADGVYRWWLIRGAPLQNAAGRVLKWFGTCTDIDDLKLAEARIREQAALIDEARDAIIVRDLDHRITFWSRGAERIYGWTSGAALGHSLPELLQPDNEVFAHAVQALREAGEWNGEIKKRNKHGVVLTLDCRWALMRDSLGEARSILSIETDITERKRLEQQFLRAQRMESIGTLAGGIAHDLNNVLGPIILSLDLLRMKFPDPASQEMLSILSASAQHGAEMVRQVLSFARGVEGRRMDVQVRHLVTDIEKIVRDTFLKNIQMRTRVSRDLWTVVGDPTQLHQVLLNLCVNARDAMPDGGTLFISAENLLLDAHYAGATLATNPGPHVCLQVEDTGTGIPAEIIDKIFDPFFTTKEVGQGTGLGLSTSQAIIKSHGGFLRVYSEPGRGTRFQVYLPAQPETSPEAAVTEVGMPRGHGELILVVDDEHSVRQITRQILDVFGYRVLLANDGAEAIAMFARQGADIAAVLTDMTMPVMDGPATIKVLRKMNTQVPIIAASGFPASDQVVHATSLGVKHFLAKPFTAEALLKVLREVLSPEK